MQFLENYVLKYEKYISNNTDHLGFYIDKCLCWAWGGVVVKALRYYWAWSGVVVKALRYYWVWSSVVVKALRYYWAWGGVVVKVLRY
jgi:hypothetical protein